MNGHDLPRPEDREIQLAHLLESLANPTRLALLRQLRQGRLIGEIRIKAEQAREGLPEERPMARQGVRLHLDRLIDAGFAIPQPAVLGRFPPRLPADRRPPTFAHPSGSHKYVVPQLCGVQIAKPSPAKGHSPTLATVHRIELILRKAAKKGEGPLSFAEIERRLPAKKTRRESTKAAIAELARFHLVAQGKKGVMWVLAESDEAWARPTVPLR